MKIATSQERAALERYGQTVINAYGDIVASVDTFNTLGSRNVALHQGLRRGGRKCCGLAS